MYKKERKDSDEENDMLFMDIIQKIKRNDFFFHNKMLVQIVKYGHEQIAHDVLKILSMESADFF